MQRHLFFVLCLLIAHAGSSSTLVGADSARIDHAAIVIQDLRSFDDDALDAYRADPKYDYEQDFNQGQNWWESFKQWLAQKFYDWFGWEERELIYENIGYAIMIAAIVLLLVFLGRGYFHRTFIGSAKRMKLVETLNEDIREMDLGVLIDEAEKEKAWRRAIRYNYLLVLRQLDDSGVIEWEPGLTDRDLLKQVKEAQTREELASLSFTFKWVWYGQAELNETSYHRMIEPFRVFLNTSKAA